MAADDDERELEHPLNSVEARTIIREVMCQQEDPRYAVDLSCTHLAEMLEKREMSVLDCVNVLRRGWVDERKTAFERGSYRYQVHTNRMAVVVVIRSKWRIKVITAWRIGR